MAGRDRGVEFRALGPLEVLVGGAPVSLGGPQLRLTLAALLVHANEVVTADQLIEVIWADTPPPTALSTVQKLIYRLRTLVAPGRDESTDERVVVTRAPGYVLQIETENFDAARFAELTASAQGSMRRADASEALVLLDEALGLWRGSAFEEFAFDDFARAEAARLDELRLVATEEHAEAKLALGDHDELVGELEAFVSANPYRERVWGQLMLSLYRSGRQAEALRAYARVRELLGEGLGIEPGAALRGLEQAILLQDPELDRPPGGTSGHAGARDHEGVVASGETRTVAPPSGTVTFLFTDLEGSTRLWDEHPTLMHDAMARHDAILRHAVEAHDGYVVKTTGDGVHAAFARADAAVEAAIGAQLALVQEQWDAGPLRVRMAMHTGAADYADGDYYGPALNRAARLMSAAHGGQVLISHATEELVRDNLPGSIEIVDLGEHRLRDLARPERAFQLNGAGLPHEFPPLRSLDAFPGNLPEQLTSFIGREQELQDVAHSLRESRLVTLTGVGGVGKTRLASQVAAEVLPEYPDGAWLCELAVATDEDSIEQVVAATLGAQQRPGIAMGQAIREFLRSKRLLLIFDNCEHLLDDIGRLAEAVLRDCPHVRILATSREGMGVPGERMLALRSLTVPDPSSETEQIAATDASRLFAERAQAVRADFVVDKASASAVAEICQRLDGIPLAIELAAARVIALRPAEIASLLDERFRLLAGGRRTGVERHQTLRATVNWSYSLLTSLERTVFDRLGVFSGGFDATSATNVVATDGLGEWDIRETLSDLVAKSMLVDEEAADGTTRYRMLETLRQYALERIDERGETDAWRRRHAEHFAVFAELARPGLLGPDELIWLTRVEADADNLRAAVTWALGREEPADVESAIRIAVTFPHTGLSIRDFGGWADRLVDRLESTTPARRYDVLGLAALWNALVIGDVRRTRMLAMEALHDGIPSDVNGPGDAHTALVISSIMEGHVDEALQWVAEGHNAIADLGDAYSVAALSVVGAVFGGSTGHYPMARSEAERALLVARRIGQPTGIGMAFFATGVALEIDDPAASLGAFEQAIEIWRTRADRGEIGMALAGVTRLRMASGDVKGALAAARDGVAHYHHFGLAPQVVGLINEAIVALAASDHAEPAAVLAGIVASGSIASLPMTFNPERMAAVVEQLRVDLGSQRYDAAFGRGEAMVRDDAVKFVLDELDRLVGELPDS